MKRLPRMTKAARDLRQRGHDLRVRRAHRRGFVLVSTIVCLMIASAITANVMGRVLRQRKVSQQRQWQDQADWLAVSAVQKAQTKLTSDPNYAGEIWQPPLPQGAKVVIQCNDERIHVTADYPFDEMAPGRRARASRTFPRPNGLPIRTPRRTPRID